MLHVTDDSGFLAVVVPSTYAGFVAENWGIDQLFQRFTEQMAQRSLLIWGTGLEGVWRVQVRRERCDVCGFREISGALEVRGGAVLVTNFESLTMAAQFSDVRLPEPHERKQLVTLPDGIYVCRIVQMFDPEHEPSAIGDGPDFVLEFQPSESPTPPWPEVPWLKR